jgi:hypothetical protein
MKVDEIIVEGATSIFGRKGNKTVRKYRCTSGSRKGRIVAKASTCTAPVNLKKRTKFKQTKQRKGSTIKIKTRRTKTQNPASRRLSRINTGPRTRKKKSRASRI